MSRRRRSRASAAAPPSEFYHGTSLAAALKIQEEGFRVDLSGSNAGDLLGPGVYMTTTLNKALHYAKTKSSGGVIFRLKVQLGRCYQVTVKIARLRMLWLAGWPREGYSLHCQFSFGSCCKDCRRSRS